MTKYTIMSYSESMGKQITVEGKVEADSPDKAVSKHLKNSDVMANFEKGHGNTGYYAVADKNFNAYRSR